MICPNIFSTLIANKFGLIKIAKVEFKVTVHYGLKKRKKEKEPVGIPWKDRFEFGLKILEELHCEVVSNKDGAINFVAFCENYFVIGSSDDSTSREIGC